MVFFLAKKYSLEFGLRTILAPFTCCSIAAFSLLKVTEGLSGGGRPRVRGSLLEGIFWTLKRWNMYFD
jgi:hypothetical protein